ncbi:WH2 domain containing protein [Cryptosporidium felis]|nr:WH2 domain containing protein [Cryptosporidium felis]
MSIPKKSISGIKIQNGWLYFLMLFLAYTLRVGSFGVEISRLAISEGLIFSSKSLDLIECTYSIIPEIIKEITKLGENTKNLETCLKGSGLQRSIVGLALSFSSGENLEYNKVKCPRLIASFLRDRILGYSCPYLSSQDELFSFVENKELRTNDSIGKRNIRAQGSGTGSNKPPTILTSIYTRLIQSCDRIQACIFEKDENNSYYGIGERNEYLKQFTQRDVTLKLPSKIGRRDIFVYSDNLLKRTILEYETNVEKESPLDPFWIVQAYRMLLTYSLMLNKLDLFVSLNSYYFKKTFSFLSDTQHLQSIDSLQLQTKYLNFDDSSKKQLLLLRASYTILESCFDFWKDLHLHYISSLFTNRDDLENTELFMDFSLICQKGFQLPLRQTLIFFYYAGIKEAIKYSDKNLSQDRLRHEGSTSEITESVDSPALEIGSNQWFDEDSCVDLSVKVPWFITSTSLQYPILTAEALEGTLENELSALVNQSDPAINPKATVLDLTRRSLSGYFVGGNGPMMYKSCTYYLKRKLKKEPKQLLLAQVTKMSKDKGYIEAGPTEKIRHFCWYTARELYPNDSSFEKDLKYETNQFSKKEYMVFQNQVKRRTPEFGMGTGQSGNFTATQGSPNSSFSGSPKRIEYKDIENIPSQERYTSLAHLGSPNMQKKHSSLLEERRREILQRLYPQSTELDLKSLVYSISDKSGDLKGVPIIKKHFSSPNIHTGEGQSASSLPVSSLSSKPTSKMPEGAPETKKGVKDAGGANTMSKLLQEIRSGVKLRPTGSSASNEILESVKKEIASSSKTDNLGISSSQIRNDLESTEFTPPLVETTFLDELENNQKFLFEQ